MYKELEEMELEEKKITLRNNLISLAHTPFC